MAAASPMLSVGSARRAIAKLRGVIFSRIVVGHKVNSVPITVNPIQP